MKTIRIIELFAGIGSQAKALERLGYPFESHKVVEFDKYAVKSYNAVHHKNYETSDIRNVKGKDLDVREREIRLLAHIFIPLPRFITCWKG